jgi:hypothetical protein
MSHHRASKVMGMLDKLLPDPLEDAAKKILHALLDAEFTHAELPPLGPSSPAGSVMGDVNTVSHGTLGMSRTSHSTILPNGQELTFLIPPHTACVELRTFSHISPWSYTLTFSQGKDNTHGMG